MNKDFGTITYNEVEYRLEEDATLSNRVFPGWWGDAEEGESYTAEYQARATGPDGNDYMVYWQFEEVKGKEPEDESNYPWENIHSVKLQ